MTQAEARKYGIEYEHIEKKAYKDNAERIVSEYIDKHCKTKESKSEVEDDESSTTEIKT